MKCLNNVVVFAVVAFILSCIFHLQQLYDTHETSMFGVHEFEAGPCHFAVKTGGPAGHSFHLPGIRGLQGLHEQTE